MINISYIRLLNAFESFSNAHLQIKRFASDFPEQVPNFGTEKENYPILFVSPNNTIFDENANQFTVDVYCFDIIEKDRININTILSDTNTILNDVYRWFKDGEIFGIDVITDTPTCTPINNGLLDYAAGWQMSITFVVDTYGICEIPFNESPVVITEVCDIVYSQYLTCETLAECPTIIDIQALLPTQDQKDAMDNANGPDASNPFATMADIGGGGTLNLQQVTDNGNTTDNDIQFDAGVGVLLDNGSRLREGTIDAGFGGTKGIAQICAVGYELKWEAGRQYVMDGNGVLIRHSLNNFTTVPSATDDSTKGYYVGSLWTLDNGISYICTDSTIGAAVWGLYDANPQVNSDWNATSGVEEILNKPTIPAAQVNSDWNATTGVEEILNKPSIPAAQIQSDWNQANNALLDFIKNKPSIPAAQVNSDWNAVSGVEEILNKPSIPAAQVNSDWNAISGVAEILNKPTIPTKTSDLTNDGDDGNPFISLQDLPSNIILYPTTAASDIVGYFKMVSSITDPNYNTVAVDVLTGVISGTAQLISSLATSANIIVGNPGVFDITTIGNIRKVSGSGQAEFFFRVYKRNLAGTETLIIQSNNTFPVTNGGYAEFSATGLWNDGLFISTDRIVIKYYANRIAGGSNPTYEFQFGGSLPVRTLVPIPLTVVPFITLDEVADVTISGVANNDLLAYDNATSLWKNKSASALNLGATVFFAHAAANPADSTTYFIGGLIAVQPATTSQSRFRIESPITGTFDRLRVVQNLTPGTTQNAVLKLNNKTAGTSVTLSSTYQYDNVVKLYTSIGLAVTIGDELELEINTPIWVTNPTSAQQYFYGYIKQ